jgi:DNA-binding MarR family transcriptional regulator
MPDTLRGAALLDDDTGFHLAVASARIATLTNEALSRHALRVRHYVVLALTSEHDDLTQIEIAREAALAASQVVALIDELERRGLVQRDVAKEDRRRRIVTATAAGRELTLRAEKDVAAARDAALVLLDDDQRDALLSCLRALNGRLRTDAQKGGTT